jgi:hypothetical protein
MEKEPSGLIIGEKEFMCLPTKKQLCLLYQNQMQMLSLVEGYKFNQKIQYFMITAALGGVGILFSLCLKL